MIGRGICLSDHYTTYVSHFEYGAHDTICLDVVGLLRRKYIVVVGSFGRIGGRFIYIFGWLYVVLLLVKVTFVRSYIVR